MRTLFPAALFPMRPRIIPVESFALTSLRTQRPSKDFETFSITRRSTDS